MTTRAATDGLLEVVGERPDGGAFEVALYNGLRRCVGLLEAPRLLGPELDAYIEIQALLRAYEDAVGAEG